MQLLEKEKQAQLKKQKDEEAFWERSGKSAGVDSSGSVLRPWTVASNSLSPSQAVCPPCHHARRLPIVQYQYCVGTLQVGNNKPSHYSLFVQAEARRQHTAEVDAENRRLIEAKASQRKETESAIRQLVHTAALSEACPRPQTFSMHSLLALPYLASL